ARLARLLLAGALSLPPGAARTVPLAALPGGKPVLAGAAAGRLHFSLSHSGGWAAIALADRPVGVDVEALAAPDAALLAACATPAERQAIAQSDDPSAAFTALWTTREALLKAHGAGLVQPLPAWSPGPAGAAGWRAIIPTGSRGTPWPAYHVCPFSVDGQHAGAVALAAGAVHLVPPPPRAKLADLDALLDGTQKSFP
ncbi:MAG: 4'-phosphopantetheinyl transferase superfamily protein, partial [Comamonas sp.]